LEDGVADIGIVGENLLIEQEKNVEVIQPLGFSKCRVSMAAPREAKVPNTEYYRGKKIATSYPNTVSKFLQSKNIDAEIHTISGSVEIAPNIGLADGICDIVSTGSTLLKNGLVETEVILTSQAVLARSPELSSEKKALLEKLLFRIQAVLRAQNAKYILMNVPNEKIDAISNILPVLKSPTIMPLAEEGWSSLHSVIEEDTFWEVIDELKENGATDILVAPINKMVR
jgi:ATP phosphoribosyltransferase